MDPLTGDLDSVLSADCVRDHPLALNRVVLGLALLVVHLLDRRILLEGFFPDLSEDPLSMGRREVLSVMGHREVLSVMGHPGGRLLMAHAEVHLWAVLELVVLALLPRLRILLHSVDIQHHSLSLDRHNFHMRTSLHHPHHQRDFRFRRL